MEITDAKYQELITDQAKVKTLETENAKLVATAENTKIALKEGRDTANELKAKLEEATASLTAEQAAKAELEKKAGDVEALKPLADKWSAHEAALAEARKTSIEGMKTALGEEFMKANADFLDGLPEEKVETYLKNHVDMSGEKPVIKTGTDGKGGINPKGGVANATEFDKAIAAGDANAALAQIPLPTR